MTDIRQGASLMPTVSGLNEKHAVPAVLLLAFLFTLLWLRRKPKRTYHHPPGPKGLPIFGYLPFLGTNHHQMFFDLSKIYGPIVRIRIGTANVIVLNDIESIREGFMHPLLQSRSNNVFFDQAGNPGVATLNGKPWKDNRTMTVRILHELGFYNSSLIRMVQKEVEVLTQSLHDLKQNPVLIRSYLIPSLSNVITMFLFGVRYPRRHEARVALDKSFMSATRAITAGTLVVFLPSWMYRIAGMIPFTRLWSIRRAFAGITCYIKNQVKDHERTWTAHQTRDFIDGYLKREKDGHGTSKASNILKEYISGNALAYFIGGTNAISRSIIWHLLNFADKPDTIQKQIQEEIDNVVGKERQPCWEDRYNMPYTMAVIEEMLRWRPDAPLGVPRGASEDVKICGYDVPNGTVVMANFWAINMNSDYWENPEEFNPSRFLDDDGVTLKPRPGCHVPFSVGKRMCPSEAIANVEAFCYITGILQKFIILPKEGEKIDLTMTCGSLNLPKEHEVRLLPRFTEQELSINLK